MATSSDSEGPLPGLAHVLRRAVLGETPVRWAQASAQIRTEREAVERMLAAPDAPAVYGFNTYLGQLDHLSAEPSHQQDLLENHLVGPAETASPAFLSTLTACKIEQVHRGGTGITAETYAVLLEALTMPAEGCWKGSYGSGDVVPAAWWMKTQLWESVTGAGRRWSAGDLIALINGSFVAAGWGAAALLDLIGTAAQFLARYAAVAVLPHRRQAVDRSALRARFSAAPHQGVQAPVSIRDAGPVLTAVEAAITGLAAAVDTRLSRPSGNPLFSVQQGQATAVSQSSFMDYRLTFALTQAIQSVHLMAGVTQRMIAYRAAGAEEQAQRARIQPPKVATALLERLRLKTGVLPTRFSGSESGGVEDVWDLATLTAEQLVAAGAELPGLFEILDEAAQTPVDPADVEEFACMLFRQLLPEWTEDEMKKLAGKRLVP